MGLGGGDERAGRLQLAAGFQMCAARGGIEEHGDGAESENREQCRVQIRGHGLEDEHGIARADAAGVQQSGGAANAVVQLRKRGRATALDDGRGLRPKARLLCQDGRDIHRERE